MNNRFIEVARRAIGITGKVVPIGIPVPISLVGREDTRVELSETINSLVGREDTRVELSKTINEVVIQGSSTQEPSRTANVGIRNMNGPVYTIRFNRAFTFRYEIIRIQNGAESVVNRCATPNSAYDYIRGQLNVDSSAIYMNGHDENHNPITPLPAIPSMGIMSGQDIDEWSKAESFSMRKSKAFNKQMEEKENLFIVVIGLIFIVLLAFIH